MHLDWIGGVLLAFGSQSLVLAAALWLAAANTTANRCLALALVVLSGLTSVHLLGWTGRAEVAPAVAFLPIRAPLALGPLLYGYVYGLVHDRLPRRPLLHLLPAALQFGYLSIVLLLPADTRFAWKEAVHDDVVKPAIEAAVLISMTGYSLASLRLLERYRAWLAQARSDADRYGARWIGLMLIALLATHVMLTGVRVYTWFVSELDVWAMQIWLAAFGAFIGIQGWRCAERLFPRMGPLPAPAAESGQDWAALGQTWRDRTRAEGWWREPDLTLADLARRLGTNTGYLSRAVNDGLGVNFNEMINRMRAEEVVRLIEAGNPEPLTALALEAGFSSKATFNRAFRAAYGVSPSARRASQIPNSSRGPAI